MTRFFIILHIKQLISYFFYNVITLPSFRPFFVLKLEVRALLQNVCNGICGLVILKIFSRKVAPRHPNDSRAFSARSRTNYFKVATPLNRTIQIRDKTDTKMRKLFPCLRRPVMFYSLPSYIPCKYVITGGIYL